MRARVCVRACVRGLLGELSWLELVEYHGKMRFASINSTDQRYHVPTRGTIRNHSLSYHALRYHGQPVVLFETCAPMAFVCCAIIYIFGVWLLCSVWFLVRTMRCAVCIMLCADVC